MPPPQERVGIPLRWQGTPDGRSRGKPIQFVRDYLAARPEGVTRDELEQAVRSHLAEHSRTAPRSFGKLYYELRRQGEIDEVEGKLVPRRLARTTGGRHG